MWYRTKLLLNVMKLRRSVNLFVLQEVCLMHEIKDTKPTQTTFVENFGGGDYIWKTKFGIKSKNRSWFVQAADHPILQIQFGLHGNVNRASSCVWCKRKQGQSRSKVSQGEESKIGIIHGLRCYSKSIFKHDVNWRFAAPKTFNRMLLMLNKWIYQQY